MFDLSLFVIQQNDNSRVFKEGCEKFQFGKILYYFDIIRNACYISCLKAPWQGLILENLFNFCDVLEECCIYGIAFIARGERAFVARRESDNEIF